MGRPYKPLGDMQGRRMGYNSWAAPEQWEIYFPPDAVVNPLLGGTYTLSPSGPLDNLMFWDGVFFRWRGTLIISEFFIGYPALWCGHGYRAIEGEPTDPAWCIYVGYEPVGLGWEFALGRWFLEGPLLAPPALPVNGLVSFDLFDDLDATPKPWPT